MALKLPARQIFIHLNQHLTRLGLPQVNDGKSLQVEEIECRDVLLLLLVVVLLLMLRQHQVNLPVFMAVNQSHLGFHFLSLSPPLFISFCL